MYVKETLTFLFIIVSRHNIWGLNGEINPVYRVVEIQKRLSRVSRQPERVLAEFNQSKVFMKL
ncbi:hypothetical protein [Bacillus atrophaeus]|uniref:hypothetical protein n=1 Tax=Bacillus atrophaeus TaxID=1452 RepID=UPI00228141CF|nr:hypothetical protein [Bacillus atrophaeus]MCY8932035.1 hypothetical protein [Bacillus atrophaeus]MCY8946953.1 hypothetical protein [Bacillus atrophaeus]